MNIKLLLSLLLFSAPVTDSSFQRLWSTLEKNPRRGPVFERVFKSYADAGNVDSLIERCEKLTETNPTEAKNWILLGLVLTENATKILDNKEKEISGNKERGNGRKKETPDASLKKTVLKEKADQLLVKAVTAFKKAESLDSENALVPFYLGEIYFKQKKYSETVAALEKALENQPGKSDVVPILLLLGRTFLVLDENEKAELQWKKAETLFPDDVEITAGIAKILAEENRVELAILRYEKIYAKNKSPEIRDALVKLHFATNQTEKALALNPKLLFSNFFRYEKKYNDADQTEQLINLIDTISQNNPEVIVKNSYELSHYFPQWNRDDKVKEASRKLYKKLWNLENVSDLQRNELRANFKRSMIGIEIE
ncbi:MAG: tetratricopeptide repeat protein [Thermoguttaceae bacterium]